MWEILYRNIIGDSIEIEMFRSIYIKGDGLMPCLQYRIVVEKIQRTLSMPLVCLVTLKLNYLEKTK